MVLINRASVIDVLCKQRTFEPKHGRTIVRSIQLIMEQPKVDAVPVVHGHWIDGGDFEQCSVCTGTHLKEFSTYYGKVKWVKTKYCPNCGACMDETD